MALAWTDELSVGYGLIDDQHKELFYRYNKLIEACKEGSGKDAIVPMMEFLMDYVSDHFREEESYMDQFSYPDKDDHITEHRELVDLVNSIYVELKEKGTTLSVITSINHKLLKWILRHVKQTDILLGRFLANKAA